MTAFFLAFLMYDKKSFLCCGQSKEARPEDITCLKEGHTVAEALPKVMEIWDNPSKSLASVTLTEEEDE